MYRLTLIFLIVATSLGSVSCGGGSGSDGPVITPPPQTPPPDSGIEGTGFAVGAIDGFGSIFVNGIEFETDAAEFIIDDQPGAESDLRVGQVVYVAGTIADDGLTGTADQVWYDSNVEGPVDSMDEVAGELVVVGQLVRVTAQTTFGDVPGGVLGGLSVGDEINVSGFVGSDGSITATRIDLDDSPGGEAEVRGVASNVDTAGMQFTINALVVDYSAATLEGFANGMPQEGDNVEVYGTVTAGTLVATRVEYEDPPTGEEGDEVEIEGLVTRFVSATDFDVAGFAVTTTASTTFENGSAAQLGADVLVEVEGALDASGVLVADKIEFGADGSIRIDGIVEAVDSGAGQLTVMTITVAVTANTRIEDKSDADLQPFSLADLNVGDYVEIRGLLDNNTMVVASRLERDEPETDVSLRGPVSAVSNPDFVVLGVTVSTSAQTAFSNTTAGEFFANADGRIVEATGSWDGTRINATAVSFED